MFVGMLEALKEESVGFLFNVTVEAAPAAPSNRVAPVAAPPGLSEFAAAAAQAQAQTGQGGVATKEREAPAPTLRAKGINNDPNGDNAPPLTYVGPGEDGTAEVQRSNGGPRHAAPSGATRKERREAARKQAKASRPQRRG
jgi:preprotein translocase subunit SecA